MYWLCYSYVSISSYKRVDQMKYVPFIVCVILFIFTSAGYFITDKKIEKIYGVLSIASIACAIVQAAIVF